MSNTSKGRGAKGSKFWIQTLVNLDNGEVLTKEINKKDGTIKSIEWLSPIVSNNYEELKTDKIIINGHSFINKSQLSFWPNNGPWWDAVGLAKVNNEDTIILVEAKAHTSETKSKCSAKSETSIEKIKISMRDTHSELSKDEYDEDMWVNHYYQLANRLTFLVQLRKRGIKVKLVLLNIVDDPTYIKTSEEEWDKHYEEVFNKMVGKSCDIKDLIILNFKSIEY